MNRKRSRALRRLGAALALTAFGLLSPVPLAAVEKPAPAQEPSPQEKYPQRYKTWTSDGFTNAFVNFDQQYVTDNLGPPDNADTREWVYKGMKIKDTEDETVVYSIARLIFTQDEPYMVQYVRFAE